MGKILSILLLALLTIPAWAEELERFPGWKIDKIVPEQSEDGSYAAGPDYYGLTPPDDRPAISIDARTAKLLKAGQLQPEQVYGRSAKKADGAEEQDVYSARNNGYNQADVIESTLPGYQPKAEEAQVRAERGFAASGGGTIYGGSYSGSSGSSALAPITGGPSAEGGSASSGSYSNGSSAYGSAYSGGQAASPSAIASSAGANGSANAAGINGSAGQNGRALAGAANRTTNGAGPAGLSSSGSAGGTLPGYTTAGLTMSNGAATGFGFTADPSGGSGETGSSSVTGTLDREPPPPPCPSGRFVYDKPTLVRVKLPPGCGFIHISAWGAGGGSGLKTVHQGRDENEVERKFPGGGGSFMSTSWKIDARKYDLVLVVGEAGGEPKKIVTHTMQTGHGSGDSGGATHISYSAADGGFPEGKDGSGGEGAGGGYSGVFLISKSDGSKSLSPNRAMAIGAGGAGGLRGGEGGAMNVVSSADSATLTNQTGEKANGSRPGFQYYPERGSAGNPGTPGKVILEYF